MAKISPSGMVILKSFPRHSFRTASRSFWPRALSSSRGCACSAFPLTAALVCAKALVLFLTVLLPASLLDFLGQVRFANTKGWLG